MRHPQYIIIHSPLLALVFFVLAQPLHAQDSTDAIPPHDSFTILSTFINETRKINVWKPSDKKFEAESLPVLYMLDGGTKEDFPHVANTLDKLIQEQKIKPVLLVGIENTKRRRDLTGPTENEKDKKIAPVVGGSEAFRSFISAELFPEIAKRYACKNTKGIIGESLAGLFITETLLTKPELFDFYIAFDPSLWWNNQFLVKNAGLYLNHFPAEKKLFWFAGSDTKGIFRPAKKLAGILKKKKKENIEWLFSPELQEKHNTIFRATKEKALIWALSKALQ